jgi:hypothetical protein
LVAKNSPAGRRATSVTRLGDTVSSYRAGRRRHDELGRRLQHEHTSALHDTLRLRHELLERICARGSLCG